MTALITISQYCRMHNIDPSFILSLRTEGLIELQEEEYIDEERLHELEVYTRWHHEMGINPEGIDAIKHLLDKIRTMQEEMQQLRNRLRLYEDI